jgi:hypothetical protein
VSSLYWLRIARTAKLYKQPEYPHVEALLEAEDEEPGDDYRMLAKIILASIVGCALLVVIVAVFATRSLWPQMSTFGAGAIATIVWFILDSYDKRISRSKARIRTLSKQIVQRVCGLSNIVGVEPAVSPAVGPVPDEAAAIYLKHCSDHPNQTERPYNEGRMKAEGALEEAMARMMELAIADSASTGFGIGSRMGAATFAGDARHGSGSRQPCVDGERNPGNRYNGPGRKS